MHTGIVHLKLCRWLFLIFMDNGKIYGKWQFLQIKICYQYCTAVIMFIRIVELIVVTIIC